LELGLGCEEEADMADLDVAQTPELQQPDDIGSAAW
jgi:hypothetical protein